MYDIEYPERPNISLKLYEIDGHWRESGAIYDKDWNAYSLGYLEAVEKLIKDVENKEFLTNTFGYPIFFLFSHYLEIRMKEIIIQGKDLIDEGSSFPQHHNLIQLWSDCKQIFKKFDGWAEYSELNDETRQNYITIDHFIKEICNDRKAQSFRYPVDKEGNPFLAEERIQTLNIHNLARVANWLSCYLEGISSGIDHHRDVKSERLAENLGEGSS